MMEQQYSLSARIAMRLRSLYAKTIYPKEEKYYTDYSIKGRDRVNEIIYNGLMEDKPFMAARLGQRELSVLENLKYAFFGHHRSNWKYIQWKGQPNFVNWQLMELFNLSAGFYPWDDIESLKRYYQLTLQDMRQVDVLGSWLYNEADFKDELGASIKVDRELMTPLLTEKTWMRALEGKKVLVIHPFKQTIERQYAQREKYFQPNPVYCPSFNSP